MHPPVQTLWGDTWKRTAAKSQINATSVAMHPFGQANWWHTWKGMFKIDGVIDLNCINLAIVGATLKTLNKWSQGNWYSYTGFCQMDQAGLQYIYIALEACWEQFTTANWAKLNFMVGFWHWHIPTMVGFCHGGNMPASHRHHHRHHVDHHHLYNCMITTILIVVQHLWGGSRGVWSTVDEVNNKCPPGSTSFTNVTQIHFFNFDWNSYIQMVLQSW